MTTKAIKQLDAENKRLENTSYFIALQSDSKLVRKILRNVKSLNPELFAEHKSTEKKDKNIKQITFPDGEMLNFPLLYEKYIFHILYVVLKIFFRYSYYYYC